MGFLARILESVLFKLLSRGFSLLLDAYKEYAAKKEREKLEYAAKKEREKLYDDQAKSVSDVAEEIKRLLKAGLPVPQELKDKLREESRKLIDGTFDAKLK